MLSGTNEARIKGNKHTLLFGQFDVSHDNHSRQLLNFAVGDSDKMLAIFLDILFLKESERVNRLRNNNEGNPQARAP
jgi:hypothetical protein